MKSLATIAILAGLVSASPWARAAPPADDAARKEWGTLELEAKWLRYRGEAAPLGAWVKFLGGAKEYELLEWVALTTREDDALRELVRLDTPNWIRCAVWRLESRDTHSIGGASKILIEEKRPALVLDWFNRHPEAARGPAADVVKKLRDVRPQLVLEPSGAYLPPLEPFVVLKALKPPVTVHDFDAERQRGPDDVYAHQVVRALDAWGLSTLRSPEWTTRVQALLRHAHPEVRRTAALACALFPPAEIPVAALDAMADDEKESASVRAAAVVATSYYPGPERYLRLHDIAGRPTHAGWSAAVSVLADHGDEFSVKFLEALAPESLDVPARTLLADTVKRIRARLSAESASDRATRLVGLLDRAALADLTCSPFEGTLVPTAIDAVRAHIAEPEVREAIEELRTGAGLKDDTRERLAAYATRILGPVAPSKDDPPPK